MKELFISNSEHSYLNNTSPYLDNTSLILDLIPTLTFPSFEDIKFSEYETFTLVECPYLTLYFYTASFSVNLIRVYGNSLETKTIYKNTNKFEEEYSKLCFQAIYWYKGAFKTLIDGAQLNKERVEKYEAK